jgi:biopolymer transport protein ExbB/TolQ
MDQNLLIIIAVFVFVSAVAMCIQAGMLFAIYRATRSLEQRAIPLLPKIDALVESSRKVVDDSRTQIHDITVKTNEILDSTKKQLARVDEVLEDATSRAKIQLDRAEMVLDDTMQRAQEAVAVVHSGVMKPLREIQGVAAGIRAGLNFLMRGRRDGPLNATADEEMFI